MHRPKQTQSPKSESHSPVATVFAAFSIAHVSKDWCCTTTGGALAVAVSLACLDYVLCGFFAKKNYIHKLRVLGAILVVAWFVWLLKAEPGRVFASLFQQQVPQGVRDLTIDSTLISPSGDKTILLRFSANAETIRNLVQARGMEEDRSLMTDWKEGRVSWQQFWDRVFGSFEKIGGESWAQPAQFEPRLYRWRDKEQCSGYLTLLWDMDTGRTFVLFAN